MSLNDSLDGESEDTYRVDFPHPRPVDNEEDFVTNSGRKIKLFSPLSKQQFVGENQYDVQRLKNLSDPNQRNPVAQHDSNKMTDSLQAELHLSLDRLSETSYDQEDLTRIKTMKSQGGRKSSIKNYPIVEKLQGIQFNKTIVSPKASPNEIGRTVEEYQAPLASEMSREYSASQDSLDPPRSTKESDDDDIRTVVVEDSLSFNDREPSIDVDDYLPSNQPIAQGQTGQADPYSHLRYNPDWRHDENPTQENESAVPSSNAEINEKHDMDSSDVPPSPEGAIIVHNESLYPSKDSPVRLSSDPSRLLLMNKKYEDEFNRMLELERQWSTVAEESERSEEGYTKLSKKHSTPNPRSKLKPPISYQRKTQPQFNKTHPPPQDAAIALISDPQSYSIPGPHTQQVRAAPLQEAQSQQVQASSNSSQASTATPKTKTNYAPTPPKAPPTNKDYIELNKARLGRKSNSASYLEMYSKKNKLQEQVKASPRRPRSDSNRNLKEKNEKEDIEPSIYTNERQLNFSIEDHWREQAERLKYAREEKSSGNRNLQSPRKTLQEVGNNSTSKPLFSPSQVAGIIKKQEYTSHGSPDNHFMADSRHRGSRFASPRKHGSSAAETDFGDHPAFSPFSSRISFHPETLEQHQHPMRPPHHIAYPDQQYSPSDYSDSSRVYPSQYTNNGQLHQHFPNRVAEHRQAGHNQDMHEQEHQFEQHPNYEQVPQPSIYHQVKYEDVQNCHPSPLMQAYQERFAHQRNQPETDHKMPLPPSHVAPLSPKRNMQDPSYQVSSYSGGRGLNEDPRYKIPLPPTPPLQRRTTERKFSSSFSPHNDHIELPYSKASEQISPSNRMKAVPHLPPILGARSSPPLINSSNDSGIVEPTPRHSISDSETNPGGYLHQHVKSKRKPAYKKYTLEDYKSLKRDINLGGLGPDLLTAKVKMGKVERARKYAEFIRQQHKSNVAGAQSKSPEDEDPNNVPELAIVLEARQRFTLGKETEKKKKEMQEKRERAIEYARRVPKPKVTPNVPQVHGRQGDTSHDMHHESHENKKADEMLDWELLKSLRDRHEREKAIVAEMSPSKVT